MIAVTFNITTDGSEAYTSTTDLGVSGQPASGAYLLHAVQWIDGTLTDGVDAVLSVTDAPGGADTTLLTLTNANDDAWYYPQVFVDTNAGVDTTFYTHQVVAGKLKLAVTSGGASKTGKCVVYLLEV
jgi:hypothetical protein